MAHNPQPDLVQNGSDTLRRLFKGMQNTLRALAWAWKQTDTRLSKAAVVDDILQTQFASHTTHVLLHHIRELVNNLTNPNTPRGMELKLETASACTRELLRRAKDAERAFDPSADPVTEPTPTSSSAEEELSKRVMGVCTTDASAKWTREYLGSNICRRIDRHESCVDEGAAKYVRGTGEESALDKKVSLIRRVLLLADEPNDSIERELRRAGCAELDMLAVPTQTAYPLLHMYVTDVGVALYIARSIDAMNAERGEERFVNSRQCEAAFNRVFESILMARSEGGGGEKNAFWKKMFASSDSPPWWGAEQDVACLISLSHTFDEQAEWEVFLSKYISIRSWLTSWVQSWVQSTSSALQISDGASPIHIAKKQIDSELTLRRGVQCNTRVSDMCDRAVRFTRLVSFPMEGLWTRSFSSSGNHTALPFSAKHHSWELMHSEWWSTAKCERYRVYVRRADSIDLVIAGDDVVGDQTPDPRTASEHAVLRFTPGRALDFVNWNRLDSRCCLESARVLESDIVVGEGMMRLRMAAAIPDQPSDERHVEMQSLSILLDSRVEDSAWFGVRFDSEDSAVWDEMKLLQDVGQGTPSAEKVIEAMVNVNGSPTDASATNKQGMESALFKFVQRGEVDASMSGVKRYRNCVRLLCMYSDDPVRSLVQCCHQMSAHAQKMGIGSTEDAVLCIGAGAPKMAFYNPYKGGFYTVLGHGRPPARV